MCHPVERAQKATHLRDRFGRDAFKDQTRDFFRSMSFTNISIHVDCDILSTSLINSVWYLVNYCLLWCQTFKRSTKSTRVWNPGNWVQKEIVGRDRRKSELISRVEEKSLLTSRRGGTISRKRLAEQQSEKGYRSYLFFLLQGSQKEQSYDLLSNPSWSTPRRFWIWPRSWIVKYTVCLWDTSWWIQISVSGSHQNGTPCTPSTKWWEKDRSIVYQALPSVDFWVPSSCQQKQSPGFFCHCFTALWMELYCIYTVETWDNITKHI